MIDRMQGVARLNADAYDEIGQDRDVARQAVLDGLRRRKANLGMIPADTRGWRLASLSRVETDGAAGGHE